MQIPIGALDDRRARRALSWWQRGRLRIAHGAHLADDQALLGEYDPERALETLLLTRPDSVMLQLHCHQGASWYAGGPQPLHRGLRGHDDVAFMTRELHRRGIAVVGAWSAVWDKALWEAHPDWRQRTPSGQDVGADDTHKALCPLSPYRAWLEDAVRDCARRYPLDAWFFDIAVFQGHFELTCACDWCADAFRQATGLELPREKEFDDPVFQRWFVWRREELDRWYGELVRAVQTERPGTPVLFQFLAHLDNDWSHGQTMAHARHASWLAHDIYHPRGALQLPLLCRMFQGLSRAQPFSIHLSRLSHGPDRWWSRKPAPHLQWEAATALAHGGAVMVFDELDPAGRYDRAGWEELAGVFAGLRPLLAGVGGRPCARVGLYLSEGNRDQLGRHHPERLVRPSLLGWARALIEGHRLFRTVCDEQLQREGVAPLVDLEVLILPSIAHIEEAEVAALERFVEGGGRLISTGPCAAPIERLLGVSRGRRMPEGPLALRWGDGTVDVSGPFQLPEPMATHTAGEGEVLGPIWAATPQRHPSTHGNAASFGIPETRALTLGPTGARIPAPIAAEFARFGQPAARAMLLTLLDRCGAEQRVRLYAPGSVELLLHTDDSPAVALHLLVHSSEATRGTGQAVPRSAPADEFQIIHNTSVEFDLNWIKSRLATNQTPTTKWISTHSHSSHLRLAKIDTRWVRVELPPLGTWSTVLFRAPPSPRVRRRQRA